MPFHYKRPSDLNAPHILPSIEVFHADDGELGEESPAGWYFWHCFPGCLPDSEAEGPYDTEAEALESARAYENEETD